MSSGRTNLGHLSGHGRVRGLLMTPRSRDVVVSSMFSVAIALSISLALISTTGGSPRAAVHALYLGSVATPTAWSATLLYMAPLLLVAVGSCICLRGGVFNIGQEGQVLLGALGATWVALRVAVPGPMLLLGALIAAAVSGAAWAALSSLMHRTRGVNIVVSTLLMTFVAAQLVGFAVSKDWWLQAARIGNSVVESQSDQLPTRARLASIGEYPALQLNGGLLLALVLAAVTALLLARSRWGLQLKMLGLSPLAARHAGVRTSRLSAVALALSGAFAGLAGAILVASPVSSNRLEPGTANGVGWDGLLIALVARMNPLLAVPVAFLFGALRAGGGFLATTGVPSSMVDVTKALLVLAFVLPPIYVGWREQRRASRHQPPRLIPAEHPTSERAEA